jgi:hypothetical protein
MSKAREQLKNHRHAVTVLNPNGTWCKENQRYIVDGCEAFDIAERLLDAVEEARAVNELVRLRYMTQGDKFDSREFNHVDRALERALEGKET